MLFRYLRKPIPQDLLSSPDALRYFENGMFWMGWLAPAKNQWLYYIIAAILMAWCIVYLPIGITITCVKDINTFSPSELLTVLQLLFNAFGTPIKVLFCKMHFWRFTKAHSLLGEMDKRCTDIGERFVVHRWVVRCNGAYLIYQGLYVAYILFTFLSATISGVPPFGIYNPFVDWRESRPNFWKAILNELLLMMCSVSQTLLTDIYPLIYGFMLRAHIQLLKQRVEKLCSNPEKKDAENQEDLVECIKDHQLIQEFAKLIHPIIARTIFTQFLLIGVCLGLSIINVVFFADFWAGLSTVVYINGLMIQTFPFCFVCDLIKSDCAHLEMAIFHSNWLNSSRRYKLSLIFFLQNCQNPIAFTAGSIFPISTSSNIQVAKLAFSVVTFVNHLNITERLTKT